MKQKTASLALLLALCLCFFGALLIACDWEYEPSDSDVFSRELRGTWHTNDPDSIYSGTLLIDYDRITIMGYGESQTPVPWGNDAARPFRNFTKGAALKGYSEEGYIYIEDIGILQAGIPYTYWENYQPQDYRNVQFLSFDFGGRRETLRKE